MNTFIQILEKISTPLVFFLAFLAILFFVLRPAMEFIVQWQVRRRIIAEKEAALQAEEAGVVDDEELMGLLQKAGKPMSDQEKIRKLAASDPEKAKELVAAWLQDKG